MIAKSHKRLHKDIINSTLWYGIALLVSPFVLWFLLGAAQEAGVDPRLLYQNYSDIDIGGYYLSIWLIMAVMLYVGLFFILRARRHLKLTMPWIVTGALGMSFAVAMIIATAILYDTTDGTEKFSGRELEVARTAVQAARDRVEGPLHMPWKYRVTAVHKGTELNWCAVSQKADGPDDLSYYSATIQGVWLFGIHETSEGPICQF